MTEQDAEGQAMTFVTKLYMVHATMQTAPTFGVGAATQTGTWGPFECRASAEELTIKLASRLDVISVKISEVSE